MVTELSSRYLCILPLGTSGAFCLLEGPSLSFLSAGGNPPCDESAPAQEETGLVRRAGWAELLYFVSGPAP